jgi:hypothetical protein
MGRQIPWNGRIRDFRESQAIMFADTSASGWTIVVPSLSPILRLEDGPAERSPRALRTLLGRSVPDYRAIRGLEATIGWAITGREDAVEHWGVAAVTHGLDSGAQADAVVMRADPVHLRAEADRLVLFPVWATGIDCHESRSLLDALNSALGNSSFDFCFGAADRWYLRSDSTPCGKWFGPDEVEGHDVLGFLPDGPDHAMTRKLINDAQMVLHDHPVNVARRERGDAEINSIWPWGWKSQAVALEPAGCEIVIAANPYAKGLARLLGAQSQQPLVDPVRDATGSGVVLFDDLEKASRDGNEGAIAAAIERLDRLYVGPLVTALRRGDITSIRLADTSGWCYALERRDIWKVWRRRRIVEAGRHAPSTYTEKS